MIVLDVLRHGECQGGDIFRGATDVALSDSGWVQMRQAVESRQDAQWQRIVSSPLRRCREFAEQQAEKLGVPLSIDEDWRELSFGAWEGRPREDVLRGEREAVERFYLDPVNQPPPGGEAADTLHARVRAAFQRSLAGASGQRVLVVTHGGVIRALLAEVLGMPLNRMYTLDVPYACLSGIHHVERRGFSRLLYHNPNAA